MSEFSPLFNNRLEFLLNSYERKVVIGIYTHKMTMVLQTGPTCGFASLLAAMKCCYTLPEQIDLNALIDLAKLDGITNTGELFSAAWLCEFVARHWPKISAEVFAFPSPFSFVRHLSASGTIPSVILVPYDCDKNFGPCCRNGHAAHWATIVGFVLLRSCDMYKDGIEKQPITELKSWDECTDFMKMDLIDANSLHLVAYQGKSRHPAIWSFTSLCESNAQLNEPNPTNVASFRMPLDGMAAIKGKCVAIGGTWKWNSKK